MALVLSSAPRAEAGKKTKVEAELQCAVPPGKGRIGADIACTLRVTADDPDDMSGLRGTIQTRYAVKAPKQKTKAKRTGRVWVKEPFDVGETLDVTLSPIAPLDQPVDFEPCVPFEIDAVIESGANGIVWSKTIKVPQKCATPKPKLACTYDGGDGKRRDALKGKHRIETPVTCAVSKLPVDAGLASVLTTFEQVDDDGKASLAEGRPLEYTVEGGAFSFTLEPDRDFVSCVDATIALRVADARLLPLVSKTLTLKQYCPD
jgi:hypothetical protein